MVNRKAFTTLVALLLMAGMLAILVLEKPEPQNGKLEKVVFAVSYDPSSSAIFVAQEKGFFRDEGLDSSLLMHTTGKASMRSMERGKAQFATLADTVLMFAGMDDRKVRCIASLAATSGHHRVIGLKSRGIVKENDLRGKRIGVPLRTTGEFFLYSFLLFRGISLQEVTLVDLQPEQMLKALQEERVDAVVAWYPMVTTLVRKLGKAATEFEDDNYQMSWNLIAGQDLVTSRPELVIRVLRALSRAQRFIAAQRDQAIAITIRFSGSDPEVLARDWGHYQFGLSLTDSLLINLEDQARWALKFYYRGRRTIPDFTRFIYTDGLRAVDPKAVGIRGAQGP